MRASAGSSRRSPRYVGRHATRISPSKCQIHVATEPVSSDVAGAPPAAAPPSARIRTTARRIPSRRLVAAFLLATLVAAAALFVPRSPLTFRIRELLVEDRAEILLRAVLAEHGHRVELHEHELAGRLLALVPDRPEAEAEEEHLALALAAGRREVDGEEEHRLLLVRAAHLAHGRLE